ncbi:MAG: glycogen synthase GlgA [Clostridiales bacterium]|jgi:starch synthase|nr:glycogen synthase GlgA [Clostridiales bacterium]MDY4655440.1 glycogen synthase GlgA [Eubacteriales bacterium]
MKILFATSEAGPFMRTGGLGDVGQALPLALTKEKQDVRVIMPLYDGIKDIYRQTMQFLGSKVVTLGWRQQYAGVFFYEYEGVKYYFIDNEYYFKRFGIYGHYDDGERFSFFSRAVLDVLTLIDFTPDVIHCNDWQTGLIPVYLDAFYRGDERYANIRTVMTIHNIEFQGEMDKSCISEVFGIPASHASIVEYNNNANMLKAGIEASHAVTTVSRTYAEEILNPYFAYGLEDILAKRRYKIRGILNGIDTDVYNPAKDSALFAKYTLKTVAKKAADKKGLQELVNLPVSADKPLIGMVTRLTNQKGMDLVMEVIEEILSMDLQMVILGTGDWKYETALNELSRRYGNKLAVIINFSKDIASKIYAGSDMFLMPSKFEPCGLSQLIAMRYGSVPIVRETGGLKDTVPAFNPVTREGRGFTFKTYNAYDMLDAIRRAVGTYYNKEEWASIVSNDMSGDYSWKASAKEYVKLYNEITK